MTSAHHAATGCVDVDADNEGVVGFVTVADGHTVDAPAAFLQGDVLLFGHDEGCVVTTALEMLAEEALSIVPFVGRGLDAVANDLLGPGFVAYSEDCPTECQHFSYYADC